MKSFILNVLQVVFIIVYIIVMGIIIVVQGIEIKKYKADDKLTGEKFYLFVRGQKE